MPTNTPTKQTKDPKYKITFKSTGKIGKIDGEAEILVLKNGNATKCSVADAYCNKYVHLIATSLDKDTFLLPYSALNFVWKYIEKQDQTQIRPRNYPKPRFVFKRTRFSRIYSDISYDKVQNLLLWFQENIDNGIFKVPASHNIAHRIKEICKFNWNKVKIGKS